MVNALEEADLRSDSSCTIPGRIGICKCCFVFFSRGKNRSTRRKTSWSKGDNENKLKPDMASSPGFEPGPHVRSPLSHH